MSFTDGQDKQQEEEDDKNDHNLLILSPDEN